MVDASGKGNETSESPPRVTTDTAASNDLGRIYT